MVRKLMVVSVLAVALAFTSGTALASSCPRVIKRGRDAAATMNQADPKVKAALGKLDEAQKLHDAGDHEASLRKANEALGDLGVAK